MQPTTPRRNPFQWRAFTSVLIAFSSLALLASGVVLFLSPPGRIANWTDWSILTLSKEEWAGVHMVFSTVFLTAAILHLVFNWRPMLNYFKGKLTRRIGFRWEWAAALALSIGVYAATRVGLPPFSSLLTLNERLKASWDEPADRAPIPHAELLTLEELAVEAKIDLASGIARLDSGGLEGATPEVIVKDLASRNGIPAQRVYEILIGEPKEGGAGHGGGGRRGAGGGPGRQTLEQFCASEGMDLDASLELLRAEGLKAESDQTLRDIAVNNGYERPFELLELLRGQ